MRSILSLALAASALAVALRAAGRPRRRRRWADGQPLVTVTDADRDGRTDVTVFFDKPTLRATGALTATTTTLALSARLPDGRAVTGSGAAAATVVFEVKFQETLSCAVREPASAAPAAPASPRCVPC